MGYHEDMCVECRTCGKLTPLVATKKCDRCWEFERLLKDYLYDCSLRKLIELEALVAEEKQRRIKDV